MVAQVADAIGQSGRGFSRVATGKVFRAQVLVASTVAKHVVDRCQDRCSHSDRGLVKSAIHLRLGADASKVRLSTFAATAGAGRSPRSGGRSARSPRQTCICGFRSTRTRQAGPARRAVWQRCYRLRQPNGTSCRARLRAHGGPRQAHCAGVAVAFATRPKILCALLQHFENAPLIG